MAFPVSWVISILWKYRAIAGVILAAVALFIVVGVARHNWIKEGYQRCLNEIVVEENKSLRENNAIRNMRPDDERLAGVLLSTDNF